MSETNEQWREGAGGNCEKCRRKPYCKKQCSENRSKVRKLLIEAYKETLKQKTRAGE